MAETQLRKPLLEWIRRGDPDRMPVLMGDARSTAASWYDVPLRKEGVSTSFTSVVASPVTNEMVMQFSKETGVCIDANLGCVTPMDVIPFMTDIHMEVKETVDANGAIAKRRTIETPAGCMTEIFVTEPGKPAYWKEHFVKSEKDLPAFISLIEATAQTLTETPAARQGVRQIYQKESEAWDESVLRRAVMGIPAFGLTCNLYMGTETAFYLLADHEAIFERLFEADAKSNSVIMQCAAQAGADVVMGAINGLEIFSPNIYEKYFVPQARRHHELAHNLGMLGWVHTCGHMDKLINIGVYPSMGVDILESLSHPPLGDITNLRLARQRLGDGIVTRGGVNVNLFYDKKTDLLRQQIRHVLDETRGYRHMIGDTNDSFPPYPHENIMVLIDEMQASGRMMKAGQ